MSVRSLVCCGAAPHEAPPVVPPPLLEARPPRPAPGDGQPGLLAARPADLPPRHRRVRDALRPVLDRPVPARGHPAAPGRGRRRLRVPRGEELPGLLRQRGHPAARRAALLGRDPALARPALPALRGPAERGDPRQAPEGAHGRREARLGRHQRRLPDAGRRRLRRRLRLQRALADRARVLRHGAAARLAVARCSRGGSRPSRRRSWPRRRRSRGRPRSRCATSSSSRAWASAPRRWRASTRPPTASWAWSCGRCATCAA